MAKALIDDLYNGLNTSDGKKVKQMFQEKLCEELYELEDKKNKYRVFDTIAEAQDYSEFVAGDRVQVLGYYSKNDGAGHERVYSLTDDGSGIAVANGGFLLIVPLFTGEILSSWFGTKADNSFDNFNVIQKISNYSKNNTSIIFTKGIYKTTQEIVCIKKINWRATGEVYLWANGSMDSIMSIRNISNFLNFKIEGIIFYGDNKSNYGLKLDGKTDLEVVNATIIGCSFLNNRLDGLFVDPMAYICNFFRCNFSDNVRDGLRAISVSYGQINHFIIDESCIFQRNGEAGLNITGTSHSISNSDFEQNGYGIKIDLSQTQVGGQQIAWGVTVKNNYMEQNKFAQVYVNSTSGSCYINVNDNYMYSSREEADAGIELIKIVGQAETVKLGMEGNFLNIGGTKLIRDADFGGALAKGSKIQDCNGINFGFATILSSVFNTEVLSIKNGFGFSAIDNVKSELLRFATNKKINFNSNIKSKSIAHRIGFYCLSTSSNYSIKISVRILDCKTYADKGNFSETFSNLLGAQLIETRPANFFGYRPLNENEFFNVEIELTFCNDGDLQIYNPYIQYT